MFFPGCNRTLERFAARGAGRSGKKTAMQPLPWTSTLGNLGLVALLLLVFSELIWRAPRSSPPAASALVGAAFGAGAVLTMTDPLILGSGVLIDARGAILATAGFIAGWPAALAALLPAFICRYCLGGDTQAAGLGLIVLAGALGVLFRAWQKRLPPGWGLPLLALAVGLGSSACIYLLLPPVRALSFVNAEAGPVVGVNILGVLVLGYALAHMHSRRTLQAEIEANAEKLQSIARNIPGTIFTRKLEPDGTLRFSFFSGEDQDLSAHAAEIIADSGAFTRRLHPEDAPRYAEGLRRSAEGLETFDIVYRLADQDGGYRWMHSRSRPRREADGSIVWHGTVLDVTDRHEAEARARGAQERDRLAQQRLLAIGQLTGGIAHEFNNLLQVSMGAAQSLGDRVADDQAGAREAEMILEASERAAELTRRLLAFSRKQMLRPESHRVASVLLELKPQLERLAGPRLGCLFELPDGGLTVRADRRALLSALLALAENACQACEPGGHVVLSARAGSGLEGRLGQVAFTVRDDGRGMTEEVRRRAVEPFFSTRPVGEGAGLGLSMAEGFARQSGGSLEIESEPGRGARVTLWLPVREGAATGRTREPEGGLFALRTA
jgi:PAS domain S-box-containing protein